MVISPTRSRPTLSYKPLGVSIPCEVDRSVCIVIRPLVESFVTKIRCSNPELGESDYPTNLSDSVGDPSAFFRSPNAE